MDDEIWRHCRWFSDYEISTYGRIRYLGEIVEPYLNKYGEPAVYMKNDDLSSNSSIWRMIVTNFYIGNTKDLMVSYVDGNPLNPSLDNLILKYRDQRGDIRDVNVHILSSGTRAMNRKGGKKVRIIETGEEFMTIKDCAKAINGTPSNIYSFFRGNNKSYHGFTFEYI